MVREVSYAIRGDTRKNEGIELKKQIEQLKLAFPHGASCPYCGKQIDADNPSVRLLVDMINCEAFCSREHFELHRYGRVVNNDF